MRRTVLEEVANESFVSLDLPGCRQERVGPSDADDTATRTVRVTGKMTLSSSAKRTTSPFEQDGPQFPA